MAFASGGGGGGGGGSDIMARSSHDKHFAMRQLRPSPGRNVHRTRRKQRGTNFVSEDGPVIDDGVVPKGPAPMCTIYSKLGSDLPGWHPDLSQNSNFNTAIHVWLA